MFSVIDALIPTFIAFGFPVAAMIIGYVKLSKVEQKEVRESFLTLKTLFSMGFLGLGLFLISIGDALTLNKVKMIGLLFLLPGGTVFTAVMIGKRSKVKGVTTVVFMGTVIYFWGLPT